MNKQKFIEYLKNPAELNEYHLEELDELVTEYPYFQAGRVLEAKANRSLKTRIAGKKTASAAIYSTNRILFKKYLKEGIETAALPSREAKPSRTAPPVPSPKVEVTTKQEPVFSEEEEVKTDDTQGSTNIDRLIYNLQQDMKELEKSRARYIEVTRKIEEEEAVEKAVKKATGNVNASATASKSTGTTNTRSTTRKTSTSRTKSAKSETGTTKSSSRKAPASKTPSATKSGANKTTTKSTSSRTRTTSTKKAPTAKKTTATKKTSSKSPAKKSTAKSSTRKSSTRAPRTTKTTQAAKKDESEGENQRELIDQFIKSNPSFKPEGDSKSKEDLSLESTILPEDMVSEHLAEIFIEQGKRDKAIKIYNSLMLRFPEKKTYFAGRINEIE